MEQTIADELLSTASRALPASSVQDSMSPSSGDVAQTPEPKATSTLANVFKSLTGSKNKGPNPPPSAPFIPQLNGSNPLKNAIYGGPPNFELLYNQLNDENDIADRIAAAEAIRKAVVDYPLSNVVSIFKRGKDLIEPTNPIEARVAGFNLLTACVQNASSSDPERRLYFNFLTAPANHEDFHLQLASVVELAKHGRDLSGFNYALLPLLTTWLKETFASTTAARKQAGRQNRPAKGKPPLQEETNLALLFVFIVDVIKFNFNVSTDETTGLLINEVLQICVSTPLPGDLRACINVIDAIITYGEIPSKVLPECITVISSIHCLVEQVQAEAWRSLSNLCISHNGQTAVTILLDILRKPRPEEKSERQNIREIRGAVSVLEKLFAKNAEDGYPLVPFTLLMDGLTKIVDINHAKVDSEILHLILSLFNDDWPEVKQNVIEEDWSVMFDVVLNCSRRALETSDGRAVISRPRTASHLAIEISKETANEQNVATSMAQTLYSLIIRIEELLNNSTSSEFLQRDDCIKFFVGAHAYLPESCAKLVIDYYREFRCCYPSDADWKENVQMMLGAFFADRSQPTHIRLQALKAVTDVFEVVEMMDSDEDPDCIHVFVRAILDDIGDEKDIAVLQEAVSFAVAVAKTADDTLFDYIISAIRGSITSDRLQSPLGPPPGSRAGLLNRPESPTSNHLVQTPSNVVTKGLVKIFMRTMDHSTTKPLRVFDQLLWIAKSHECETDARVSAMKMLVRLRADWANRIFLTPFTESDGLAASLYRTPASITRKQAADEASQQIRHSKIEEAGSRLLRSTSLSQNHPQARQPFRAGSGVNRTLQRNHQMWMSPDSDALPDIASGKASSLLLSIIGGKDSDETKLPSQVTLNMGAYLETIIGLLQHGCDWEIYSYILVHLSSQLTNQALFKAATSQINTLRGMLCDQIKNGSFHEPPMSSGLRKADIAICLFQILTMVMGYHQHFTKLEDDEIVRTFLLGVGTWERAAKCCIHALSICCHELPASTSKALATILTKMSQIITQSHVAVHILEFLACLARLPNLYVNFREEDYRTIFGICFRYLQYVRDQSSKDAPNRSTYPHARNSGTSLDSSRGLINHAAESNFQPNTSDDLPQYVYALAYHVIIFWFLCLKLPDRAGQVSWISKNLISVDANGKEKIDEQAQVTLDFMQRVAYADVDESAADPTFTPELFGEILKKRWIVGYSIVTVEQATRGGWAQITKRQPSGTSCYIIREKFTRPPPHQSLLPGDSIRDVRHKDANVVLPSHLLLQLAASIPQSYHSIRPIPLPDDDMTKRSIAAFDRNFTVDGHKVGVIYIGEHQRTESEILANIMGSSDYTEFLSKLGSLTKLQGAKFNTQGLDREYNSDGEYAYCWRDRVTEIVFHVTTQMPTDLEHDPQCINKKRHIGNDFVNIIFNNSGLPFQFNTFPSDFNYVNIVITPESRASFVAMRQRSEPQAKNSFYKVQVMSKPGFPEISPASETKIMSLAALPCFIRLLALNASVFSLVWSNREGGEHVSSWRNRLNEINRLRERHKPRPPTSTPTSPPGTSSGASERNMRDSYPSIRRSSVANLLTNASESNSQRSSILSTAEIEVVPGADESMVENLDFSRWA
ncbi:hypothetical protein B7494_g7964 [Chlorociboria aeruginascens]|nr:hypothetical protein B7494_g7964 [Chlorociboria aeruginascens]